MGLLSPAKDSDLGFNPVEVADFLLGWTTLDITGDDTPRPPVEEADSLKSRD